MRQSSRSGGASAHGVGDAPTAAARHIAAARATIESTHWLLPREPASAAFAPARLDVLGGIADYSGATVLELPLARGAVAIAQRTADASLSVATTGPAAPAVEPVTLPLDVLLVGAPAEAPERLRAALRELDATWAAYVLGPVAVLVAEGWLPVSQPRQGLRVIVWSDVPPGAGISSSAALEVASLRALQELYAPALDALTGMQVATLAQRAEHRVALAPCGIMDQATSALGLRDHLLMLRCQPCDVLGQRPLPAGIHMLGIDSGVAHRVATGQYGRVRAAAFMGRRLITKLATAEGHAEAAEGYLCDLTAARFEETYAPRLPEEMQGADFLARYGDHGDPATTIDPETRYQVRACTAHPVYEAANVSAFLDALDTLEVEGDPAAQQRVDAPLLQAGDAMYRSHASYGARCGLGSPETDLLVELARTAGPAQGVYGARITGGGAGGTIAVLVAGSAGESVVHQIAAEYTRRSGHRAVVFAGSADGALRVPPVRFLPGGPSSREAERDV